MTIRQEDIERLRAEVLEVRQQAFQHGRRAAEEFFQLPEIKTIIAMMPDHRSAEALEECWQIEFLTDQMTEMIGFIDGIKAAWHEASKELGTWKPDFSPPWPAGCVPAPKQPPAAGTTTGEPASDAPATG